MKSIEKHLKKESDYYIYSPSKIAQKTFLYPTYTGHFIYENNYSLKRISYDSFLLMYIQKGSIHLEQGNISEIAREGQFALLDCFVPHAYYTTETCDTLWLHFNGIIARPYYELITTKLGMVFSIKDPFAAINKLSVIYKLFSSGVSIQEARMSKYIADILTEFALYIPASKTIKDYSNLIEDTISFISQHLADNPTVEQLAEKASLSTYHFIRIFKKETGFTPHDYIINVRLNTAKYLLSNTSMPIKAVCFNSGFSNESVFSSTFKKKIHVSPLEYRNSTIG